MATTRRRATWVVALTAFVLVGVTIALTMVVWEATTPRPGSQLRLDKFEESLQSKGWQASEAYEAGTVIQGEVVFGDCKLAVEAPSSNPSDITIRIPATRRSNNVTVHIDRKLASTSYDQLKALRGNYLLKHCFLEALPKS